MHAGLFSLNYIIIQYNMSICITTLRILDQNRIWKKQWEIASDDLYNQDHNIRVDHCWRVRRCRVHHSCLGMISQWLYLLFHNRVHYDGYRTVRVISAIPLLGRTGLISLLPCIGFASQTASSASDTRDILTDPLWIQRELDPYWIHLP